MIRPVKEVYVVLMNDSSGQVNESVLQEFENKQTIHSAEDGGKIIIPYHSVMLVEVQMTAEEFTPSDPYGCGGGGDASSLVGEGRVGSMIVG